MAAKLIICRGLPASGKSTWARAQVADNGPSWVRVNMDDIRTSMFPGLGFTRERETTVVKFRNALIGSGLAQGLTVISDDTNLNPRTFNEVKALAGSRHPWEVQDFTDVPVETCIARNNNDDRTPVPDEVMYRMFLNHLQDEVKIKAANDWVTDGRTGITLRISGSVDRWVWEVDSPNFPSLSVESPVPYPTQAEAIYFGRESYLDRVAEAVNMSERFAFDLVRDITDGL